MNYRKASNLGFRLAPVLLALALAAGCGRRSASSVADSHPGLFPSGQLKQEWDTAKAAMRTNGYVTAVTALRKMQLEKVSAEQLNAINDTLRTLNLQMINAADKGDANANNALKELGNKSGRSRSR